jgi:hypothetical protein
MDDDNSITEEEHMKIFGCDSETYDKMLCENEYRILKERENVYEEMLQMEKNDTNTLNKEIIVIAYFHYDTLRSDIELFYDENSAKEWLFDRWGFLLKQNEIPSTLKKLIELCSEKDVTIEIIKKKYN